MKKVSRRQKSKRYLWQGLCLLLGGSALLLSCKIIVHPAWQSALLFGGGGAILLGNGYMLYGLLHHADSRSYDEESKAVEESLPATHAEPEPGPAAALSAAPNPLRQERGCG